MKLARERSSESVVASASIHLGSLRAQVKKAAESKAKGAPLSGRKSLPVTSITFVRRRSLTGRCSFTFDHKGARWRPIRGSSNRSRCARSIQFDRSEAGKAASSSLPEREKNNNAGELIRACPRLPCKCSAESDLGQCARAHLFASALGIARRCAR